MRLPRWLDRIWLAIIGVSFLIAAPLWFIIQGQHVGFVTLTVIIATAFAVRSLVQK